MSSSTEWSYFPWSQVTASETLPPIISTSTSTSTSTFPDVDWNPSYQPYTSTLASAENQPSKFRNDYFTNANSYNNEYNTMPEPHRGDNTYRRLNSIDEQPHFDYDFEDESATTDHSQQPSPKFSSSASPLTTMSDPPKPQEHEHQTTTRKHRQPAWGHSRSRANSTSSSTLATRTHLHKRRNSTEEPQLSPLSTTTTTDFPAKIPRLQPNSTQTSYSSSSSLSTPFSPPTTSPLSDLPSSAKRTSSISTSTARLNHNQVEKQYRNRLNSQFESLLSALPAEEVPAREEGEGGEGIVEPKKVSKAEVLVLAEKYIKQLEKEKAELRSENKGLKEKVQELRQRWIQSGGVFIP